MLLIVTLFENARETMPQSGYCPNIFYGERAYNLELKWDGNPTLGSAFIATGRFVDEKFDRAALLFPIVRLYEGPSPVGIAIAWSALG